jgi:hypothetical protein
MQGSNGSPPRITKRYMASFGALYGDSLPPPSRTTPKKRKQPERDLVHLPLMCWARHHPICKDYLVHFANERKCSPAQGAMLKAMGVKSGVSDLFLAWPGLRYPGYWLELKQPGRKPTETQEEWFRLMNRAGFKTAWFDDWEKAKDSILEYLGERNAP